MRTDLHHVEGSGPDLVYVPGVDGSGEMLFETAEKLREHFRLIQVRYDPGREPWKATLDDLSMSLQAVLETLGVTRPFVLTESFGGAVTLNCAASNPDAFRAIAVVNSFARYPRRMRIAATQLVSVVFPAALFSLFRPVVARQGFFGKLCEDDAYQRFLERETLNFDDSYRRRLAIIRALDLRANLANIRCPVHLFASESDRVVPSVKCAKELQALIPQATLRTIPCGGHVVLPLQGIPWVEWLREAFASE